MLMLNHIRYSRLLQQLRLSQHIEQAATCGCQVGWLQSHLPGKARFIECFVIPMSDHFDLILGEDWCGTTNCENSF